MNYNAFRSIVSSRKKPVPLRAPTDSFRGVDRRPAPYVEPTLSKLEFPVEKPSVVLVTAMGASGKTTTAQSLAADLKLPLLDLAIHKPVGDNTLTGTLTKAYGIEQIGQVLQALRAGTHCIVIDGIDEARSKTSERAFEAFLDDLIERCSDAPSPTVIIFGRGQVLLDAWCYLQDRDVHVGLVGIDPFDLAQAKDYIDSLAAPDQDGQRNNYIDARDGVLAKLGSAVGGSGKRGSFLSFLGYPPVLDAVATLLKEERNYHRVKQALEGESGTALGNELLLRISHYLLDRDQTQKALPNFIEPMTSNLPAPEARDLRERLYDRDEQCARTLAAALRMSFPVQLIEDPSLNEQYEENVSVWSSEHPFLNDGRIRNPVFSAVAVARCALSERRDYRELAYAYTVATTPTSHLLHVMSSLAGDGTMSASCFNMLMQACSEFVGIDGAVVCEISGEAWEDAGDEEHASVELTIDIEHPAEGHQNTFSYTGVLDADVLTLGPVLLGAKVTVPGEVMLKGMPGISIVGECTVSARRVVVDAGDLVVRPVPSTGKSQTEAGLFVSARSVEGHADSIVAEGVELAFSCEKHQLDYPLAAHARLFKSSIADPDLDAKYRRLRRILSEFRSHSRGSLAKYRAKIEHQRVLQNAIGEKVLDALLAAKVLRRDTRFYFIEKDACDRVLGVTWHQLRQYETSERLQEFLRSIKV